MITRRHIAIMKALLLLSALLLGCVQQSIHDPLENDYNQLNQRLAGEIRSGKCKSLDRKASSERLFPSGGFGDATPGRCAEGSG